jgi:tripartite-type tricarboxylate transporter receptor subunit TctC
MEPRYSKSFYKLPHVGLGSLFIPLLCIFFSMTLYVQPALSQEAGSQSKQLRLLVGSGAGGAYDSYGRTVAAHMSRYLPNKPKIIIQNMPGVGSLIVTNHLYNVAPRDGSVIAAVHSLTATHPLFVPDQAKYDVNSLNWLGSAARETTIGVFWSQSKMTSFDDAFKKDIIVAGSTGSTSSFPFFTNTILGTRFNIVKGYSATSASLLAMERGEVEGTVGVTVSALKSIGDAYFKSGKIKVLVQFGMNKHPDFLDVPWIFDYAKSDDQRAAMNLMFGTQEFGRPFIAPPDVPSQTVQILREAFLATLQDKQFLDEAEKRRLDISYTAPDEIRGIVKQMYSASPHVVSEVKRLLGDQVQ